MWKPNSEDHSEVRITPWKEYNFWLLCFSRDPEDSSLSWHYCRLGRWVVPTRLLLWGQNPIKGVVSRAAAYESELYQALTSQVKIFPPFLSGKLSLALIADYP